MSRLISSVSLVASLLFTAACTQPAAHVELRGQETFGPGSSRYAKTGNGPVQTPYNPETIVASYSKVSYPAEQRSNSSGSSYASDETSQDAAVSAVGVSDLSPPQKAAEPAKTVVIEKPSSQAAEPSAVDWPVDKQASSAAPVQSINPWTKKPRDLSSEKPQAQKAASPAVVASRNAVNPLTTSTQKVAYIWPVESKKLASGYGAQGAGKVNDGVNIVAANGEPVWAAADGEVVYADNSLESHGNMIIIKHPGGKTTSYAHLSKNTVDKYDRVKQGDIIGYVGSSGHVKNAQLYFEVRDGKQPVDPMKVVSRAVAGL
ncbi:MAG: M23 family metallopeptidase [Rickettsiales bacterium]|nr:M23 family metallopeptidase [Rickettsiales bacterium]